MRKSACCFIRYVESETSYPTRLDFLNSNRVSFFIYDYYHQTSFHGTSQKFQNTFTRGYLSSENHCSCVSESILTSFVFEFGILITYGVAFQSLRQTHKHKMVTVYSRFGSSRKSDPVDVNKFASSKLFFSDVAHRKAPKSAPLPSPSILHTFSYCPRNGLQPNPITVSRPQIELPVSQRT